MPYSSMLMHEKETDLLVSFLFVGVWGGGVAHSVAAADHFSEGSMSWLSRRSTRV